MPHPNPLDLLPVVVALALAGVVVHLWLAVGRLRRAVRRIEERSAPPAPPPRTSSSAAPAGIRPDVATPGAGVDEGILAAIAAAVCAVVRQPHHIVAIQPDAGAQHAWSAEGRRELYHSHKVR